MKKVFLALLFILGLVFSWFFYLESRKILAQEPTAWLEDHSADCAVVLTGGPQRVREGFDLLAQRRVKKLVLSGVHPGATLREIFPQWTFYGQLRESDVILEKRSKTTYGNVQQTIPLLEALYCRDFVLITSREHMYRALKTFNAESEGRFSIYPRAIVARSYDITWLDLWAESLKSLFYELFAY